MLLGVNAPVVVLREVETSGNTSLAWKPMPPTIQVTFWSDGLVSTSSSFRSWLVEVYWVRDRMNGEASVLLSLRVRVRPLLARPDRVAKPRSQSKWASTNHWRVRERGSKPE